MLPIKPVSNLATVIRGGRMQQGNVIRLWSGRHEQHMRIPAEHFAAPARVITLPDMTKCSHDEVRDMAKRAFRAERAALRTAMMRSRSETLLKGAA